MKNTLLIVDDQPEVRHALKRLLQDEYAIFCAESGEEALATLKKEKVAVILADQRMPRMTGVEFLEKSLELQPHAVRILITAYADIHASVAAVNQGQIFYYVSKPWEPEELLLIVKRAVERHRLVLDNQRLTRQLQKANQSLERENRLLKQNLEKEYDFSRIIGHGPRMQQVFKLVSKVVETPTTVLLLGETGTGKELLARAIHFNSRRKERLFVTQNCGALPDALLESELFGHVKGAFTGAVSAKKGLFEAAHQGTIFLDEVGDTSPAMQLRLLRVLQEGEIRPVGSHQSIQVDVRVLAATNKNLEDEVKAGRFREDLFYRLHVFPVSLPPLRERREDIPDLALHFLSRFASRLEKSIPGIADDAMEILMAAPWPGNIRELENEMERAVTLADADKSITRDLLSQRLMLKKGHDELHSSGSLKEQVEALEIRLIQKALHETGGNILKAAEKLGLSRPGLHKKISRYEL